MKRGFRGRKKTGEKYVYLERELGENEDERRGGGHKPLSQIGMVGTQV